jgi:hypothetical protein
VPSILIPITNRRDLVFDPIRNQLDITTSSGTIQSYNIGTQSLLAPLRAGTYLNGADITPDGSTLFITEAQTAGSYGLVHMVNLANGAETDLGYLLAPGEGGSWDIALGPNGIGLVDGMPGSGPVALRQINLSNLSFQVRSDVPGSGGPGMIGPNTLIHRSANRSLFLITEANQANGPMFTYNALTNSFSSSLNTGISLNNALSAVNRNGTLIALEYNGSVIVTDPSFNVVTQLANLDGGVEFDPVQDILYAVSSATSQVVAFDTRTWAVKYQLPIGESVTPGQAFGSGVMAVSSDDQWLFLATPSGVREINLPSSSGPAASLAFSGYPYITTAGTPGSFTATALDANGNTATSYRGIVHFTSSDPQAVLPADYTFTAADSGTHTFTATFKTAGNQGIAATDISSPSISGVEYTGVNPAALAGFRLSAPSGYQAAFYAFNVTVTATDAYGNAISNYTGTVHFASTDAAAVLPANYIFTAGDNGVHTFSVTLETAGNDSISATDTGNSAITGAVTVPVANYIPGLHFGISASVNTTTAGTPFSVTVTAYDVNNNVAVHYVDPVQFSRRTAAQPR